MEPEQAACALVGEALGASNVTPDDTMQTLAGWDSLGHLAIVAAIESRSGRRLSPEQIVSIASVRDVAEIVHGIKR